MEDEEDVFVGDVVTCVLKVVRENELKEGVTPQQVLAGEVKETEETEESEEEEKEGEKEEKNIVTAEEYEQMASEFEKPEAIQFERGVVYSKRCRMWGDMRRSFPFKIHEHWYVLLSDAEDKYVLDYTMLTPLETVTEERVFPIRPMKAEKMCYHLHFLCPCYVGLDFTVAVKVKPESMKPKVVINQKDLDLDKKKGLIDVGVGVWSEG